MLYINYIVAVSIVIFVRTEDRQWLENKKLKKIKVGRGEILEWIPLSGWCSTYNISAGGQLYALTTCAPVFNAKYLAGRTCLDYWARSVTSSRTPKRGGYCCFLRGENTKGFITRYKIFLNDVKFITVNKSLRSKPTDKKRIIAVEGDTIDRYTWRAESI